MKRKIWLLPLLFLPLLPSCGTQENAVKPLLSKNGYTLSITTKSWDDQNDDVKNGKFDFNYFQHLNYLQAYETNSEYDPDYVYQSVFPIASVHFEPLRVYSGKNNTEEFESIKKTATYEICSDPTNCSRAMDFLVSFGVVDSYEKDESGTPIHLPENITCVKESEMVSRLPDFDYAVIPCNTAFEAQLAANPDLPTESTERASSEANVIAGSVRRYRKDKTYRMKAELLAKAVLDSSVTDYINSTWNQFIIPSQVSYLNKANN